jgi:hypothetical protein
MTIFLLGAGAAAAAALGLTVARRMVRLRGARLVDCPETGRPAGVEIDLRQAALGTVIGRPVSRLRACSRWPARRHCGEPCLDQLEDAEDRRVWSVLARWYEGRKCAYCGARFGPLHPNAYTPLLLAPEGTLQEWSALAPEDVPAALRTHQPVCWNCSVVQGLRRERPDLFAQPRAAHR